MEKSPACSSISPSGKSKLYFECVSLIQTNRVVIRQYDRKRKRCLCDGRNFQNTLEQLQILDLRNQSPSLKWDCANGREYQYDDDRHLATNNNENSNKKQRSSKYKRRNNYSRTDQSLTTKSSTHTN
ncbi:unnamed protein product [Rotaria sp. Silwood1]|nr:unnamed protein product [Rotaria sp. Silwood1]